LNFPAVKALVWHARRFPPPIRRRRNHMKALHVITLILVIVGGINWGLVGLFGFDLVAALFGTASTLSRTVYTLVGVSALWQLVPLTALLKGDEPSRLGHSVR
jgi:uncharacterized membrane protein YuzA (DUF378 family)